MIGIRQLFLSHTAQTSPSPLLLEVERANGIYIYDFNGKAYIDLISGIGVSNLGHTNPQIVKAVSEQASKFMHLMVYGEYIHYPQVALSKLLTSLLPASLNQVYLVNSGAESTEGAIKLAKKYTGRAEIISFHHSYHGSTNGALSLLGDEYFKANYRPLLPATFQIRYNETDDLAHITEKTAAVFVELVKAEEGVVLPLPGYLKQLKARCEEMGALLVVDEIQTGMGRTGPLFAFEAEAIIPDILLLAKAFGGGLPVGAFIANEKIMSVLSNCPVLGHITTFGGNPVCAAAALTALEILSTELINYEIPKKEQLFVSKLTHPLIKEVRHKGLMIAIELSDSQTVLKMVDLCMKKGLIVDWFLFAPHCLRICPPLIISYNEIETACSIILEALDQVANTI